MIFFADFNGIRTIRAKDRLLPSRTELEQPPHLGDSLVVMLLAEKEELKGKVQTIYMDPPYGIKFHSNW